MSKDILERIDRNDGMTVPDGFFASFAEKMEASLPEMEWERQPKVLPRSMWQKVRPYVYLAAMFAGVWCMMNMVDLFRPGNHSLSLEGNPVIAAAVSNDYYIDNYFINEGELDESELMDDLYTVGFDPSAFEESINM